MAIWSAGQQGGGSTVVAMGFSPAPTAQDWMSVGAVSAVVGSFVGTRRLLRRGRRTPAISVAGLGAAVAGGIGDLMLGAEARPLEAIESAAITGLIVGALVFGFAAVREESRDRRLASGRVRLRTRVRLRLATMTSSGSTGSVPGRSYAVDPALRPSQQRQSRKRRASKPGRRNRRSR